MHFIQSKQNRPLEGRAIGNGGWVDGTMLFDIVKKKGTGEKKQ
jgi:hypothetical protein